MNRRLTFYRLCERLASKLQSLFVPLVGQIIKDVCHVLKQTSEGSAVFSLQRWCYNCWSSVQSISKMDTSAVLMLWLLTVMVRRVNAHGYYRIPIQENKFWFGLRQVLTVACSNACNDHRGHRQTLLSAGDINLNDAPALIITWHWTLPSSSFKHNAL